MKIESQILECARNKLDRAEVTELINYSERQLDRICNEKFGCSYKKLQDLMVFAEILKMHTNGCSSQMISDRYFYGDTPNLYTYIGRFSDIPLKKIEIEGGRRMTKAKKQMMEAQVITLLVNSEGKNITLKQLGVPRSIIASLRKKNFEIISVPGRYNGGYNLGRTSKDNCLDWINKIRQNRFGLTEKYTF